MSAVLIDHLKLWELQLLQTKVFFFFPLWFERVDINAGLMEPLKERVEG